MRPGIRAIGSCCTACGSAFGCGFVAVSIAQRARRIDTLFFDLDSTFAIPRELFFSEVSERFTHACRPARHLILSGLFAAPFLIGAYLAAYADNLDIFGAPVTSLRPVGFAATLYEPSLRPALRGR